MNPSERNRLASGLAIFANAVALYCVGAPSASGQCDQWHPLDSNGQIGVNNAVTALAVHNGDLIVGGHFHMAGGQTVNYIARWVGSSWQPFISNGQTGVAGATGPTNVSALTIYGGDLVAAGDFDTAGGQTMNNLARWDGSTWHPFVAGSEVGVNDDVGAMMVMNGDLIAGGLFKIAGGETVNRIARWDGTSWHPFASNGQIGVTGGTPFDYNYVSGMTVYNDQFIAGGLFATAGGQTVNHIARWDGLTWHPFVFNGITGMNNPVLALTVYNGDLIAAGWFTHAGGLTVNCIARWDGKSWHPLMSGGQIGVHYPGPNSPPFVSAITVYNEDLIVAGLFTTAGGQTVNNIARWDGSAWHPFVARQIGISERVLALALNGDDLFAGGLFTSAGGQSANNVAGWQDCGITTPGDVNGDGVVGVPDLVAVINNWGSCPAPPQTCPADIAPATNGDGAVNVLDLLMVVNNWG